MAGCGPNEEQGQAQASQALGDQHSDQHGAQAMREVGAMRPPLGVGPAQNGMPMRIPQGMPMAPPMMGGAMPTPAVGAQLGGGFQAMAAPLLRSGLGPGMAAAATHGSSTPASFAAGRFAHGDLDLGSLATGPVLAWVRVHRPLEGRQYYFLAPRADATDIGVSVDPNRKSG